MDRKEFVNLKIDDIIYSDDGTILRVQSQWANPDTQAIPNEAVLSVCKASDDRFRQDGMIYHEQAIPVSDHERWFSLGDPREMSDKVKYAFLLMRIESLENMVRRLRQAL